MAKMIEIKHRTAMNEVIKMNERLERANKTLAKKIAAAEKEGVADWTFEDRKAWLDTVETENGWIVNKADVKKNGAWFDLFSAQREVEDIKERIENAERKLAKAEEKLEQFHKTVEEEADLKKKEELWKIEFEQEQKEWAMDGIKLEGRYWGETPKGERFLIERNHGWTERSFHCFTLTIGGETVFTSGEFWRAYGVIKNR